MILSVSGYDGLLMLQYGNTHLTHAGEFLIYVAGMENDAGPVASATFLLYDLATTLDEEVSQLHDDGYRVSKWAQASYVFWLIFLRY